MSLSTPRRETALEHGTRGSPYRSPFLLAAGVVAVALFLSIVESSQLWVRAALEGWQVATSDIVGRALSSWLLLAALVPIALFIAARYRIERPVRRRAALIHAASSVGFALLHISGAALLATRTGLLSHPFTEVFGYLFVAYFALDLVLYWAILGAHHAVVSGRELRARELEASRLEARLSEERLRALRQQLNPHFLFNTLNAIATQALRGDVEAVTDSLSRLSELLRQALSVDATAEVPVSQEIAFAACYLDIQRLRFPERLSVRFDVDSTVEHALVPSMILQPVVENAITHGIAAGNCPGVVTIGAKRRGDVLVLEVTDTGAGVAEDVQPLGFGIGLSNTRARLEHLYGDACRLELERRSEGGTRVTIEVPYGCAAPSAAHARLA